MDSFWSKLLILGIVAAIGLFFIGNVYTPQKSAQEAMADSTQQSVNAVKMGIDDTATWVVRGDEVIDTVEGYCKTNNTINIVIEKENGNDYIFTTSTTSTTPAGQNIEQLVNPDDYYEKNYNSGEIRFIEI